MRETCPHSLFFLICAGTDKLVGSRPAALSKLLPNSQELSSTSSSEGEKDSPPPEWDAVPVHKPSSCKSELRSHCSGSRPLWVAIVGGLLQPASAKVLLSGWGQGRCQRLGCLQ